MNHGCSTKIPRPNGKVRNGKRKFLLVRRKHAWAERRWKPWLLFFFDNRGIVHKEFVPPGQAVNHAFYKDVLERLWKRVQRVRRGIADDWLLQHDNAPAHTALSIREFLVKKNIPVLPHPPYSPNLATCNFSLFPKLKSKLKGHHFGTIENIPKVVTDELNTLMENDFQYCYDQTMVKERLQPPNSNNIYSLSNGTVISLGSTQLCSWRKRLIFTSPGSILLYGLPCLMFSCDLSEWMSCDWSEYTVLLLVRINSPVIRQSKLLAEIKRAIYNIVECSNKFITFPLDHTFHLSL